MMGDVLLFTITTLSLLLLFLNKKKQFHLSLRAFRVLMKGVCKIKKIAWVAMTRLNDVYLYIYICVCELVHIYCHPITYTFILKFYVSHLSKSQFMTFI